MYNRKFNVKKDFSELNELENVVLPIVRNIKNNDKKILLENYLRKIFNNQFKR